MPMPTTITDNLDNMYSVSRTFDENYIHGCVTNPDVWRAVTDDGSQWPDLYFPDMNAHRNFWLEVRYKGESLGVFLATQKGVACFEVHSALQPCAHGLSVGAAKAAIAWMFDNTPCKRIIAWVPACNPLAGRMAIDSGLQLCGVNKNSFLKGGILYDEILFGISKGK